MELLKLSSKKIKIGIVGILIILILGYNSPVYAVSYHFQEDFSSATYEDWNFVHWVNDNPLSQGFWDDGTNHTFTFDNELVSAGDPNPRAENWAILPDTTVFGAWSMDIFVPANSTINEIWDSRFSISMWNLRPADFDGQENTDNWPVFWITAVTQIVFTAHGSTASIITSSVADSLKFDIYQHYNLIRTSDTVYLYVDGELVIETDLQSNVGPEIGYFALGSVQGSGVKFDNLKITNDTQGVLDSILSDSETNDQSSSSETTVTSTPVSQTSSKSTSDDTLFYAAGTGIVTLTGTVSYWRLSKKKI